MTAPIRIAVTGAAGQIGYSLLFRLASGETFGDRDIILHLLDLPVPEFQKKLEGVAMELTDCAFPHLAGIELFGDADKAFAGINGAFLVGAKPRGPGMERKDLIADNGKIFKVQGKALERAASDVRVLVVGNPCNTNALIALKNCSGVPANRFSAMTRLDQNRARALLATKTDNPISAVSPLVVWGNHSSTLYPDFENATINGKPVAEVVGDVEWLRTGFVKQVQQRGAVIIAARGTSSAASAANASIDHVRDMMVPTPAGKFYSAAVYTNGEAYGVPAGLVCSFPLRTKADGSWEIVEGFQMSDWARGKFDASVKELHEERAVVADLLG